MSHGPQKPDDRHTFPLQHSALMVQALFGALQDAQTPPEQISLQHSSLLPHVDPLFSQGSQTLSSPQ